MLTVIIEKQYISNNRISIIEKSEINHIINVYRMSVGDEIRAVDGEYEYLTYIVEIAKKEIILEIKQKKEDENVILRWGLSSIMVSQSVFFRKYRNPFYKLT